MDLAFFRKPSRYINREINSIHKEVPVKVALAFPDIYEIGMSHLGLKILYKIINEIPFASAERVFSPWIDLEAEMKTKGILLSSLETNRPLRDFDILGFSLQYELLYTTVLNMLQLGGIPLKADERNNSSPLRYPVVIAGGPCTVNPAPLSPFIDAFLIGDGEEAIREILDTFYRWKKEGVKRRDSLLLALSEIEGVYVPSIKQSASSIQRSELSIQHPGFFKSSPVTHHSSPIKRRFIKSLDETPYPDSPVVPYTAIVHDRINIEVSRGCSRGCRFCQAGTIYRPVRERSPERVLEIAENSLKNTGYGEVSFTSLSAGDYSCLLQVVKEFNRRFSGNRIALSFPSLRVGSISRELLKEIRSVRKTGFTFAPEAGTERLRGVINKDFSEDDYEQTLKALFEEGWHTIKLYFMLGLPTETDEDIEAISRMVMKALRIAKQNTKRFVNINVGVSPFVPKPHTPFQWFGQEHIDELKGAKDYLREKLTKKGFKVKDHDVKMSLLEAGFSRGDVRLAPLLEKALSLGCRLDGWSEIFDFDKWERAMDSTGINVADFAEKTFTVSDKLPWENIGIGVTKEFLWQENQRALSGQITHDCRTICHNCGLECETSVGYQSPVISQKSSDRYLMTNDLSVNSSLNNTQRFKSVKMRVEFSKTGQLRYLSHLELIATLLRAIRRADFPLKYSEGYNPTPRISFGPPLGVGFSGMSEYFDIEILPPFDIFMNRRKLNSTLPEGIYVKDMAVLQPEAKSLSSFITRYRYEIKGGDISYLEKFLSQKNAEIEREGNTINLRAMVEEVRQIAEDTIQLVVIDQGDIKVRMGELLPKILHVSLDELIITRIDLYGWDGGWIKPLEQSSQWTAKF